MNTRRIRLRALQDATPAALLALFLCSHATPTRADLPETVLHTFAGPSSDGANSLAGVEIASDGTEYGTTERGGTKNLGTIFKISPTGVYSVLHNFGDGSVSNDGKYPTSLNIGPGGSINGMTIEGGAYNYGTAFAVTPTGTVTILHSFAGSSDGANPYGGVTIGNDGEIYGVTSGIADQSNNDYGTVFSMNTDGTQYAVQFRFTNANRGTDGENPDCTLTPGLTGDSALYGTTYSGGSADSGTVFSVTPGSGDGSGTFKLLHTFGDGSVANDGANPDRGRMQPDSTGDFFSTTLYGGDSDNGTVWELTPSGTETILHSFEGEGDGANPEGTMTLASDGNYYGDTINDGAFGAGEVFSISKTGGTFSVVYDFNTAGDYSDGANPYYGPAEDSNGNLIGTTFYGGDSESGGGVVYEITAGLPNPVKLSAVTLTPTSVVSGSTSQLLITLKKPAPQGGAVVTLTSSAAAATVPGSVTIPVNAETATVTVNTGAVSSTTSATISATYNATKASAKLTVTPGSSPKLTAITLSPTSTPGTVSTTNNSVSLSANAVSNTTVTLTSSNTSAATVPSSVVIKAGSSSQLFTIATQAVTSAQTVTITATANGVSLSNTLTVVPGLKSITLQASSVSGGTTTTTNRAYLTGNAAAATSVTITSSNSSVAKITTTPVTIAAGSSSHVFTIVTSPVTTTQTVTITATANGISKSSTLTVTH